MSLAELAAAVHYSTGQLSRVETGSRHGTPELARACDEVLGTGDLLVRALTGGTPLPPMQLPPPAAGFVGREQALSVLDGLRERAIGGAAATAVVNGMGGVGKTTFAVHWAESSRKHFPDGVLFADLRAYDPGRPPVEPDEILDGFLRGLHVDPQLIAPPGPQRTAQFRTVLQDKAVLIILDNASSAAQVRPLLPGAGGCMTVVTSRRQLTGLAVREGALGVTLGQFEPAEAVALLRWTFERGIGGSRLDAGSADALRLAESCGYLPLALRVIANRVLTRPYGSLGEAATDLERIGDRLDTLSAADDETVAVRSVFSWSYADLDLDLARTFRLLSLHPGTWFSTGAAAALLGLPADAAAARLGDLVSLHLVQDRGRGRYGLHDLLRLYAGERLVRDETEAAREAALRRHLEWYVRSCAATAQLMAPNRHVSPPRESADVTPLEFDSYDSAVDWCEAERANMRALLDGAADAGLHRDVVFLVEAAWAFYYLRRHFADWLHATQVAVDSARATGDVELAAMAYDSRGSACAVSGLLEESIEYRELALAAFTETGLLGRAAIQLSNIGDSLMNVGRHAEAITYLHRSLERFDGIEGESARWGRGIVLANLGESHLGLGELAEAETRLEQALDCLRGGDSGWVIGGTLTLLGKVAAADGRRKDAERFFRESLDRQRGVRNQWGEAGALTSLGSALADLGEGAEARECWERAVAIYEEIGDTTAATSTKRLLAGS